MVARTQELHHQRWRISLAARDALWGYFFIAPAMIGFFLLVLYPLYKVIDYSLHSRNLLSGQISYVGTDNYEFMLKDDTLFDKTVKNSLVFTAGLVPLNMVLALTLALLLSRRLRGTIIFRTIFFAPVVTSAVAWAIVWRFMLQGESGAVNQFLALFGLDGPNWLREPNSAMFSVIFTRAIKNTGLNMIIILSALANQSPELEEAARVDGANGWQVTRHITIPLLVPTLLLVSIITVSGSLKVFDTIMLLTQGGPSNATMVLVYYIYYQGFRFFEIGYASALAVMLFGIALVLTVLQWSLRRRLSYVEQ
jgi:multiple sugar transport system permease protein